MDNEIDRTTLTNVWFYYKTMTANVTPSANALLSRSFCVTIIAFEQEGTNGRTQAPTEYGDKRLFDDVEMLNHAIERFVQQTDGFHFSYIFM